MRMILGRGRKTGEGSRAPTIGWPLVDEATTTCEFEKLRSDLLSTNPKKRCNAILKLIPKLRSSGEVDPLVYSGLLSELFGNIGRHVSYKEIVDSALESRWVDLFGKINDEDLLKVTLHKLLTDLDQDTIFKLVVLIDLGTLAKLVQTCNINKRMLKDIERRVSKRGKEAATEEYNIAVEKAIEVLRY